MEWEELTEWMVLEELCFAQEQIPENNMRQPRQAKAPKRLLEGILSCWMLALKQAGRLASPHRQQELSGSHRRNLSVLTVQVQRCPMVAVERQGRYFEQKLYVEKQAA